MELSPNDQVLRALFKINEECKAILRAMDEIETQNGNGTEEEQIYTTACKHGIHFNPELPCTRCEYERRGK